MNEVVNFPTNRTGRFIISKEKNYCETRSQISLSTCSVLHDKGGA